MYIKINFKGKIPIYKQLRNQIVEGIATGELKRKEVLPSARQMAADLGINVHIISKSYKMLQNQDFVTIHKRKGTRVNPPFQIRRIDFEDNLFSELKTILSESYCRGISKNRVKAVVDRIYKNFTKE